MPVPSSITDLSTTAAVNYPAGSDSPSTLDDVQRAHGSFIALIRDSVGLATGTLVPATARSNIGAAASGANNDITSLASPAIAGATATTQAVFDNTTKVATTAFVQRALGNASGLNTFAVNTTLSSANAGTLSYLTGASTTITLPVASTCPAGVKLYFESTATTVTVQRNGTDVMNAGSGTVTSVVLNVGDTLELTSTGASWVISGGSVSLSYSTNFSGLFASSLAASGYQKLPSGMIIQWGTGTTNGSGILTQSMPITFPSTFYGASANLYGSGNNVLCVIASQTTSSITINAYTANTAAIATAQPVSWITWGK